MGRKGERSLKIHVVQKDETLWNIAQKYGVSVDEVIAANPQISNPNMVMPGMKITVPANASNKQQAATPNKAQPKTQMKEKQEMKPKQQPSNQILPAIEEDEQEKWEPLKKEMPALPLHFNQQPIPQQPQPSQEVQWAQFTNNFDFETHFHPAQKQEEKKQQMSPAEAPKEKKQPPQQMQQPIPQPPMPMQQPMQQQQAPCYSQEGIPFGYTNHPYQKPTPLPANYSPQVMGTQMQQPSFQQPMQHPYGNYQQQPMQPQSMNGMPWQQPMQQQAPPMQQQGNMQMQGQQPMIPQPGMPGYPMAQFPQQMSMFPPMNDCGCGDDRKE